VAPFSWEEKGGGKKKGDKLLRVLHERGEKKKGGEVRGTPFQGQTKKKERGRKKKRGKKQFPPREFEKKGEGELECISVLCRLKKEEGAATKGKKKKKQTSMKKGKKGRRKTRACADIIAVYRKKEGKKK